MPFQERSPYSKRNRQELTVGTAKSTFLNNLKIETYTLASEDNAIIHYALTASSLKKVYDEYNSMMISAETPIQLLPLVIDNVNNTINRIDGLGALASRDNVGSSQISSNAVGSSELQDNAVDTASIVNGAVTNSKITSINASKVTSGTLDTARIPGLSASKITSGTLDTARLPTQPITTQLTPTYILGETGSTKYRYDWNKIDTFGATVPDILTLGGAMLPTVAIRGDAVRVSKDCAKSTPCSSIHVHGTRILIGSTASPPGVIEGLEFGVNISDNTDIDGELTANEVLTNKLHCPGLQMNYTLTGGSVVSFSAPNRGTSYLKWSRRIMAITVNVPNQALLGDFNVPGYIQIDMPPTGTRITSYILGDISTVTVGSAGIPMVLSVWFSLYYEFVPGTNGAVTDNSKFVLIDYSPNSRAPRINSNWILIATFNSDDQSLKWMPGSRFMWPGTFYNSADGSYSMTGDVATADPSRTTGYDIINTVISVGGEIMLFNPIGVATSITNEAINTTSTIIKNYFGIR